MDFQTSINWFQMNPIGSLPVFQNGFHTIYKTIDIIEHDDDDEDEYNDEESEEDRTRQKRREYQTESVFVGKMVNTKFHQYQVVGRGLPTKTDEHPEIYCMKLWATNEVHAKSKFSKPMRRY
ncbi:uncharacterized protein LOC131616814 [Vicia villosa]|uniref:uncharacterized protein LOC131616814 n=1 Tax=Vicia villosa TaxID=3911 RepID=UPI00273AFEAE|nr:uncharacterized protein LOC131616814 [Vicia villosa]